MASSARSTRDIPPGSIPIWPKMLPFTWRRATALTIRLEEIHDAIADIAHAPSHILRTAPLGRRGIGDRSRLSLPTCLSLSAITARADAAFERIEEVVADIGDEVPDPVWTLMQEALTINATIDRPSPPRRTRVVGAYDPLDGMTPEARTLLEIAWAADNDIALPPIPVVEGPKWRPPAELPGGIEIDLVLSSMLDWYKVRREALFRELSEARFGNGRDLRFSNSPDPGDALPLPSLSGLPPVELVMRRNRIYVSAMPLVGDWTYRSDGIAMRAHHPHEMLALQLVSWPGKALGDVIGDVRIGENVTIANATRHVADHGAENSRGITINLDSRTDWIEPARGGIRLFDAKVDRRYLANLDDAVMDEDAATRIVAIAARLGIRGDVSLQARRGEVAVSFTSTGPGDYGTRSHTVRLVAEDDSALIDNAERQLTAITQRIASDVAKVERHEREARDRRRVEGERRRMEVERAEREREARRDRSAREDHERRIEQATRRWREDEERRRRRLSRVDDVDRLSQFEMHPLAAIMMRRILPKANPLPAAPDGEIPTISDPRHTLMTQNGVSTGRRLRFRMLTVHRLEPATRMVVPNITFRDVGGDAEVVLHLPIDAGEPDLERLTGAPLQEIIRNVDDLGMEYVVTAARTETGRDADLRPEMRLVLSIQDGRCYLGDPAHQDLTWRDPDIRVLDMGGRT